MKESRVAIANHVYVVQLVLADRASNLYGRLQNLLFNQSQNQNICKLHIIMN